MRNEHNLVRLQPIDHLLDQVSHPHRAVAFPFGQLGKGAEAVSFEVYNNNPVFGMGIGVLDERLPMATRASCAV